MPPPDQPPADPPQVDLDAYFARIGYTGPRAATRGALDAIVLAHVVAIPFENLDVLSGRRISLELPAIEAKLVQARRRGYCFEQNTLLLAVLGQLGFEARPISARVRIGRPRDYTPPRTHLFLRVELGGDSLLVDVGVGGLSPTAALRLELDTVQPTPHEPRRIVHEEGRYFHQARLGETWQDVCEFTLEEMPTIDRELGNWYTSAHPQSNFRNRLTVARAGPNGERLSILNDELTLRERGGAARSTRLSSPEALLAALDTHFGLHFSPGTTFALLPAGRIVAGE